MTRMRVCIVGVAVAMIVLLVANYGHGQPVNISKQVGSQSEGDIGIDPTNPQRLFMASNNNTAAVGMFCAFSTDGGVTWTKRAIASGADGLPLACCDPVIAWDSFGNLFMSYLDDTASNTILVRSIDGGATFGLAGSWSAQDQPKVAVGANSVWVSWNNGSVQATGAPVTGLGLIGAFVPVQTVATSAGGNFGGITITPTGAVMLSFQNAGSGVGPDSVRISVDPDGLGPLPFSAPTVATPVNVGGFAPIPPQNVRTVDSEGKLACDRSGGPNNGRIYLVYTDSPAVNSPDTNIFVRTTNDLGVTWSAPLKVNDDVGATSQFFPKIAVDQTTGNVAVAFYDSRNSPTNTKAQVFAAVSTNGGATFQANVQVTSGFSNTYSPTAPAFPGLGPAGFTNFGNQYGDYIGICFHAGNFFPLWCDNSNSTNDNPNGQEQGLNMYTAKMTVGSAAGVTITQSGGTTNVTEGGATDTYTVVLNTAPTAAVTITMFGAGQVTAAPNPLTFTPANWNVAQTVTVTAVDDVLVEGPHTGTITHTSVSGDLAYNAIAIANVTANITDNDAPAAGVTITQSGGTTTVTEGGATDTFTVVLTSAPTAAVNITLNPGTQVTVTALGPFNPANWNVPQTVTVTAVDDALVEGPHIGTITFTAASADAAYNAIVIPPVTVNITDNDLVGAGVLVTQSGGTTDVAEGGVTDNYTVVLNSLPTGNVTITLNPGTQVTVLPATTLTFTTVNWNVAQTVTVTAIDDALIEGAHTGTISHTATSTDAAYNGIAITSVIVNIADNDGVPPQPPTPPGGGTSEGNYPGSTGVVGAGSGGSGEGSFGFGFGFGFGIPPADAPPKVPILNGPYAHPGGDARSYRVVNVSQRQEPTGATTAADCGIGNMGLTLLSGLALAAAGVLAVRFRSN